MYWHRWLPVYCVFLVVLNDCQSFFLRHNQTGKCIRIGPLMYSRPHYALSFWAITADDCLDLSSQFRYLASELVQHLTSKGNFHSTTISRYQRRLAIYKGVSSAALKSQDASDQKVKQKSTGSLLFYEKGKCYQPASANYYLVEVSETNCDKPGQQFTFGSVTSYNRKMVNVGCSPVQMMDVKKADYGNFDNNGVFDGSATADATCSIITNCQVKSRCNGKKSCHLTLDNKLLLQEYCSDTSKEVYTKYTCVDNFSSITSITSTGENLRLHEANEGHIEIKDGSIWRKVYDKGWDQDRQKMLCQHLGFEVTAKNELSKRGSGTNEDIATGDLIFYKQSGEISCCAAMEGYNTSNTDVNIPYVKCKICDKPLFKNYTLFPDTVFSGLGSKARLYDGGWCSWEPGTRYLTIDLQKEYHISQVVTMCRDDQKWCTESYSLQYSHDRTLDGNVQQITGNKNGYQASFTTVSIYNVRHIKIKSAKRDFCLRIELCGEVQTPAPVQKITVSPSSFSALVSWTLLGHDKSSYITEYAVRLNRVDLPRISREMYGNNYTVTNLTPITRYMFEIRTLDDSLQQSSTVTKDFKTTNAGPVTPVVVSYSSLNLEIPKPFNYLNIQGVMVIVQAATNNPTSSENIRAADLKPYQTGTQDPYITAYLTVDDLPLEFVIGDGKEYKSDSVKYPNQRLKQSKDYIVFLRFFDSTNSAVYSTKWSKIVRTFAKLPDPVIKVISTGSKTYSISWTKPSLPAPLKTPTKGKDGYKVLLKKPKQGENIKRVSLVLLRLKSNSSKPILPVELEIPSTENKTEDVPFIAKEFDVSDFNEDTIEISLRDRTVKTRRKREAEVVYVELIQNTTYVTMQMNTDENGKAVSWSDWSEPITFTKIPGSVYPVERGDDGGGGGGVGVFAAAVGATIGVVIIVALVLAVIFFKRKRKHDRYSEGVVDNVIREEENDVRPDIQPFNGNDDIHFNENDSIQEPVDGYELVERIQDQPEASCLNVGDTYDYARPDEAFRAESPAEQEASAYMSLKNNREPGNLYQPLQHSGKISDQDSIQERANKSVKSFQDQREASYMNVDCFYERPGEAFSRENSAEQEASAYMSLKDSREPGNLYEPLQHSAKISDRGQTKGGER